MTTISVDDREQTTVLRQVLMGKYRYTINTCRLELGDYHLPGGTLLERKTLHDFCLSIIDGRLFSQAYRLVTSDELSILVLEGTPIGKLPVSNRAFRGALVSLAQTYRLPVLRTLNECDTAWCIDRLVRQKEVLGTKRGPAVSGNARRPLTRRLHVLRALPGIGPRLAGNLFDHFGSVSSVANATPLDLAQTPGIGAERASVIYDTLHEQPGKYVTS
ncbi:MAG: hypothetical protein K9N51_06360 [Candidatus Pacebacteria bacterium]|nr:hypothetical protein [Candidatus Paceibacterota bacterium]